MLSLISVWAQGQLSRGPLDLSGPVRSCGLQCERSASGHPKSPLLEHLSSLLIETTHTHTGMGVSLAVIPLYPYWDEDVYVMFCHDDSTN